MTAGADVTVCTIIARNYLAYARVLMDSVARHHPEWRRVVLLVDRIDGAFEPEDENFEVVELESLPLPDFRQMAFRYTLLELSTAVKPWLLEWLLARGATRAVYLDPDIEVHAPLSRVTAALEEGASVILTPHLTAPLDPGREPDDLTILRSGAYNLGFLAVAAGEETRRFLGWWQEKNERECVVEQSRGLFVDQRWIDLVPGLYEGVSILRDEGYNVAYWNLAHRRVSPGEDGYQVNGVALAFFHWSGLDPLRPEPLSTHQNRFRLSDLPVVAELARDFVSRLEAHGFEGTRRLPYAFGSFDDHAPITDAIRFYYRNHADAQRAGGPDPFALPHEYFNEPGWRRPPGAPLVSRAMRGLWEMTDHLQTRFPQPQGAHRQAFAAFYAAIHAPEFQVPSEYTRPVIESLRGAARIASDSSVTRWTGRALRALRPLSQRLDPATKRKLREGARRAVGRLRPGAASSGGRSADAGAEPKPTLEPPRVAVIGYLSHPTGVGSLARRSRHALGAVGLSHRALDCDVEGVDSASLAAGGFESAEEGVSSVNLLHVNADELPRVAKRLGHEVLGGRYNVGIWAWELPRFPDRWVASFDLVDEIWAPSEFVQRALAEKAPVPVLTMPPAVFADPIPHPKRSELGLPEDSLLLLCACDTDSVLARKNPLGTLEAFQRAFPQPEEAGVSLVVKAQSADPSSPGLATLRDAVAEVPGVLLIDRTLTDRQMQLLEQVSDICVSLHRSEGFGLVPAECMALGKPAIATGWSGNLEYMRGENAALIDFELRALENHHPPYARDEHWAEPDLDHAAHWMRKLATDPQLRAQMGAAGRQTILRELSPEAVGRRYRDRLGWIGRARS